MRGVASHVETFKKQLEDITLTRVIGKVTSVTGIVIECTGLNKNSTIGTICNIYSGQKSQPLLSEVVGFKDGKALLMPFGETEGIGIGDEVELCNHPSSVSPDETWLGRIINAFGQPIDNKGPLNNGLEEYPLKRPAPNSHSRNKIGKKIDLGVRAIDTFTSCCYGQRMGIFAGSGVGKSVLISMITKYADTDIKIIGLVGERGREVREFIEEYLGEEGLKKSIIVVATGDEPALLRKRAAFTTMAIAEYFRDQGKEVLCIIDSVTRLAMAQREIGLAIGEPPTSKGYTPSVFTELPKLLERAGPGVDKGNITGLFTVLVEGDDQNEPISDAVRGILDGHIVLDRSIADRGRFPAVNILKSVSRALPKCNTDWENEVIIFAKRLMSVYNDMAEMIRLGAYKKGTNKDVDLAIEYYDQIESFLNQKPHENTSINESYKMLAEIVKLNKKELPAQEKVPENKN